MSESWIDKILFWLIDVHILSALLLGTLLLAFLAIRQPARRMTFARAGVIELVVLAILTAIPGWPRWSWRSIETTAASDPVGPKGPMRGYPHRGAKLRDRKTGHTSLGGGSLVGIGSVSSPPVAR